MKKQLEEKKEIILNDEGDDNNGKNPPESLQEKLLKTRTVTLFSQVTSKTAREAIQSLFLLEADNPDEDIKLFLNSPGGEISSGFSIFDTIRFIKPEVKIICGGLCASIATVILMAAKKENRLSLPNCEFLIHQPLISGGLSGPTSDIEIHAKHILSLKEKIIKLMAEETNHNSDQIAKDIDRDFWMTAEQAKDYGLVSKIVLNRSDV